MNHYTEQQVAERIGIQGGPAELGFAIRRGDLPVNDSTDANGGRLWKTAKFDAFIKRAAQLERPTLKGSKKEGQQ